MPADRQAHFEENPRDLAFLRHDKPLNPSRVQPHLKHVPSYLMPRIATVGAPVAATGAGDDESTSKPAALGPIGFHSDKRGSGRGRGHGRGRGRGGSAAGGSRRSDPLKTFKSSRGRK